MCRLLILLLPLLLLVCASQPRLLICDEATSALDTATEASILSSLDELARVSWLLWLIYKRYKHLAVALFSHRAK